MLALRTFFSFAYKPTNRKKNNNRQTNNSVFSFLALEKKGSVMTEEKAEGTI